jgi:hypothetical protein
MLLKTRRLFLSGRFDPAQSLNCREVDYKAMETAATGFVRHPGQILVSQFLDISRVYSAFLSPGLLLLNTRSLIQCRSPHERRLVAVEDVGLRSPGFGVYYRRAIWAMPQKKLPDKLTTANGAQESASGWFQQLSHFASPRE